MISVRDLRVHFPVRRSPGEWLRRRPQRIVRAVDGIDLDLAAGEIVALVGESGCGKTTTGRALVRLAPISGGRILHQGRDVTSIRGRALADYRRQVQIVFQDPYESLDARRTIGDQVREPLVVQGVAKGPEREARVARALEDAGLRPATDHLDRYPHELSGGQRQRVAIAVAMVLDPEVLVADEPVSMLDVSLRSGILRVMLELREQRGVSILFITHDLSLAWLIADRVVVMYLGRIVESGAPDQVVHAPQHPYTKALIAAMPTADRALRARRQILAGETPDASRIPPGCRFHTRCPVAMARCQTEDPPFRELSRGHLAACLLLDDGDQAEGVTPGP